MLAIAPTEVRPRSDPGDAHLAHVPLHRLAVDHQRVASEMCGDPSRAVEGVLGIERVDPMLDGDLFERRSTRPVIQTGTTETQEVGLNSPRQLRLVTFHECETLVPIQVAGQVFFSQATWVVSRPISA